jgi:hypothetical protein
MRISFHMLAHFYYCSSEVSGHGMNDGAHEFNGDDQYQSQRQSGYDRTKSAL